MWIEYLKKLIILDAVKHYYNIVSISVINCFSFPQWVVIKYCRLFKEIISTNYKRRVILTEI
jgi:hypothetical protein